MDLDWTSIITTLAVSGGIVYLIVERILNHKKYKEEVKHQQVENKKEAIEYGLPMVEIYNEIDKIVESKTRPIQDKLDKALGRIDNLETNWVCWRQNCDFRLRNKKDAESEEVIDSVAHTIIAKQCEE